MIRAAASPWSGKLLWFVAPSLIGATVWWMMVGLTIHGQVGWQSSGSYMLLAFIACAILALGLNVSALFLTSFLTGHWGIQIIASLLAVAPLFFFFPLTLLTGIAFGLAGLGLWWGMRTSHKEAENRLTVRPAALVGFVMPAVLVLMFAATAVLYDQRLQGSSRTTNELTDRLVEQTVTITERFMPLVYKQYKPDITVDDLIGSQLPTGTEILKNVDLQNLVSTADRQAVLRQRLEQFGVDPNTVNVDVKQSQAAIAAALDVELNSIRSQAIGQARDQLGQRLGLTIRGDERIHDVLLAFINRQYTQYVRQYVRIIPPILALGLFLILRTFAGLFSWIAQMCAWALWGILKAGRLISVEPETAPVERAHWRL